MASYATINEAYGKNFSKKKKKNGSGSSKKQSACHYYAKRYSDTEKEQKPFNIEGLDKSDMYSSFDKNSSNEVYDLYASRQDFIKANKDKINDCDIKEEQDYFDKLYKEHDFRPMMSRDGDNFMKVEPTEYEPVDFDNSINRSITSDLSFDVDDSISVTTSMKPEQGSVAKSVVGSEGSEVKRGSDLEGSEVKRGSGSAVISEKAPKTDYESDKHYMDLGLYLISGILLIFILEQFVQIGGMLRSNRMNRLNTYGGAEGNLNNYQPPPMYYPPPPNMYYGNPNYMYQPQSNQ
jgi:hypothetical protein